MHTKTYQIEETTRKEQKFIAPLIFAKYARLSSPKHRLIYRVLHLRARARCDFDSEEEGEFGSLEEANLGGRELPKCIKCPLHQTYS